MRRGKNLVQTLLVALVVLQSLDLATCAHIGDLDLGLRGHLQDAPPSQDISAQIDAWTASATVLDCPSKASSSVPSVASDLPGDASSFVPSVASLSDVDRDDDDDEDDDDDMDHGMDSDHTTSDKNVLTMSATQLLLEAQARKAKRCHINLGHQGLLAQKSAKEAKAGAMEAKTAQKKAQRKAAIAAFRMSQALAAQSDAKTAEAMNQAKSMEAADSGHAFRQMDKEAKAAAIKAVKMAKATGKLFKAALVKADAGLKKAEEEREAGMALISDQASGNEKESGSRLEDLDDAVKLAQRVADKTKARANKAAQTLMSASQPDPPPEPMPTPPPACDEKCGGAGLLPTPPPPDPKDYDCEPGIPDRKSVV